MNYRMISLFALITLFGVTGCHDGVNHAHSESDHHHHGDYQLTLDNGNKWQSDEALRQGMSNIQDIVRIATNGPLDHSTLMQGVTSNIDYMVQNCKLDPEPDGVLHVIIGEMVEGLALLDDEKSPQEHQQGLERIEHALSTYGDYFEHPDWQVMHHH